MQNSLSRLQLQASKLNILISFFLLGSSIFSIFMKDSELRVFGAVLVTFILAVDLLLFSPLMRNHRTVWCIIRGIELILFSGLFVIVSNVYTFAFLSYYLMLLFFELLFSFDYSDIFIRVAVLSLEIIPAVIALAISLLASSVLPRTFFEKMCLLFIIYMFVIVMGDIVIQEFNRLEERFFEQRRMADNTQEINETLKIHRDKLKHANEEMGIQKIKLESAYNRINNANMEMILQNEILKQTSTIMDVQHLVRVMTDLLFENLDLALCSILLTKEANDGERQLVVTRSKYDDAARSQFEEKILSGDFNHFLNTANTYLDNHVRHGEYTFLNEMNIGSIMILPFVKERIIGALIVGHLQFDYFAENRVFFATIIAQFMISLQNAKLYYQIEQMAICDGLTGIYNRRHLNVSMESFATKAEKENTPLSVALFDIDHFKTINDTYGHLFGDLVIKSVASIAGEMAKKYNGFAARYGGEEFVLAYENRPVEECCQIVDEMRAKIRKMNLEYDGILVNVNVSVGVTSYPQCCSNSFELLEHADWAMYYSKKNGRDRVTIDSPDIRESLGLRDKA